MSVDWLCWVAGEWTQVWFGNFRTLPYMKQNSLYTMYDLFLCPRKSPTEMKNFQPHLGFFFWHDYRFMYVAENGWVVSQSSSNIEESFHTILANISFYWEELHNYFQQHLISKKDWWLLPFGWVLKTAQSLSLVWSWHDITSLINENYIIRICPNGKESGEGGDSRLGRKQKSLCLFPNYPFTIISTALDIIYHMQLVRHSDFEIYCFGIEYKSRNLCKYILCIIFSIFTLILLLFLSIVTYIEHLL